MGKQLKHWGIAGFFFTAVVGTLLHFAYDWSGDNPIVAMISSVNESVWEHMKLLVVPVLIFSVIQFFAQGKNRPDFLAVRGISTLVATFLIPVLFYTYTGILGYHLVWVDILIFYLAAAALFLLDAALFQRGTLTGGGLQILGLLILWGLLFLFVWCTFHPVMLNLWRDPVTGGYGIAASGM